MANIATFALKEQKWLHELLRMDFMAFVGEKTDEIKSYGYERVPGWTDVDPPAEQAWWRNWYDEEKDARHRKITAQWQDMVNKKYEFIWKQQLEFAAARDRVLEQNGKENAKQTYFITIAPLESYTDLHAFFSDVKRVVERKSFLAWTLSFEQRGLTEHELGVGFHVHIVAKTTYTSIEQVRRAIQGTKQPDGTYKDGTFARWMNDGRMGYKGVDVQRCINPKQHTQRYLIDYEADDEHKIATKDADGLWRGRVGLQPLYTSDVGLGNLPITKDHNRQVCFA